MAIVCNIPAKDPSRAFRPKFKIFLFLDETLHVSRFEIEDADLKSYIF